MKSANSERLALLDFLAEAGEAQLYRARIIPHNLEQRRPLALVFN